MAAKNLLMDFEDLIDFQLYGIISGHLDAPWFVYLFNREFGTRFARIRDMDVKIDEHVVYFPVFEWEDVQTGEIYHIIKNQSYSLKKKAAVSDLTSMFDVAPVLISQYKDYAFFLKVSGENSIPLLETNFIRKITKLRTERVKTIERLLF